MATPKAQKGVLDLTEWNFSSNGNIALDGDWAFYWQTFQPDTVKESDVDFIKVPGFWNNRKIDSITLKGHGFATYRLKIRLPKQTKHLSLRLETISTAYRLSIDGKNLTGDGTIGTDITSVSPSYKPHVVSFDIDSSEIDLQVKVSNFHHRLGGIWQSMELGNEQQISATRNALVGIELFLIGSILIMSLYHLGLFVVRSKDRSPLYFGVFCLMLVIRISVTGQYTLNLFYPLPWKTLIALEYLSFYLAVPTFSTFVRSLFPKEYSHRFLVFNYIFSIVLSLVVLTTDTNFYSFTITYFQLFLVSAGLYTIYVMILAIVRKRRDASVILAGFLVFFGAAINDILYQVGLINSTNLVSEGLFFFILSQAFFLSSRFSRAFVKNEELKEELTYINKNLENLVDERTHELRNQNEELQVLNAEITAQRDEIEQHHNEISSQKEIIELKNKKILDSIHYAKRIQNAVLPTTENINELLPENFIFYQPRDIVSGDFYYIKKIKDKLFIVVADCTGHGVPGAFMSILGVALLNDIVHSRAISEPHLILEALRKQIKYLLQQAQGQRGTDDGMEIAICVVDTENMEAKFAGAGSPLLIIRNGETLEVKPDRMPVGVYPKERPFTSHSISLFKKDAIYLFTDGYLDQVGGPNRRKFQRNNFKDLLLKIAHLPMEAQKQKIANTIKDWMGDYLQTDDMLVLGAKIN